MSVSGGGLSSARFGPAWYAGSRSVTHSAWRTARETPMISEREVAFYREQGYLVVPDVLEPETLGVLRRDLVVILEGARAVTSHTDVYDLEPGHRADDPRVRRIKTPHKFLPAFERLTRHPRLLAVLQALL